MEILKTKQEYIDFLFKINQTLGENSNILSKLGLSMEEYLNGFPTIQSQVGEHHLYQRAYLVEANTACSNFYVTHRKNNLLCERLLVLLDVLLQIQKEAYQWL